MHRYIALIALWSATTMTATAGLDRYVNVAGYLDLGDLRQFESGNSVTEVIIPNTLIRMVATMVRKEEPQFADMLRHLELVHVHAIEVADDSLETVTAHITGLSERLDKAGWDVLVRMREGDEQNQIYVLPEGEEGILGLCVLALDGAEAVFVNIVGKIDLDMLGRLGEQFDIPGLDDATIPDASAAQEESP
jgi:hypothetical protein